MSHSSINNFLHGRNGKQTGGFVFKKVSNEINGEHWLQHPDFDVECSTKGRIKRKSGFITFGSSTPAKYKTVSINCNHFMVHRLIAEAYWPDSKSLKEQECDYPYVNHIDRDKENNDPMNLEWVTPKENTQRAIIGYWNNK